jgi:hypothetical protein
MHGKAVKSQRRDPRSRDSTLVALKEEPVSSSPLRTRSMTETLVLPRLNGKRLELKLLQPRKDECIIQHHAFPI